MNMKYSFKFVTVSMILVIGLTQVESACKELRPVRSFQEDYMSEKFYWILQAKAYDNQDDAPCPFTYSFVDGNIWTFIDMAQNSDRTERFVKEVGTMDRPGHWNVSTVHNDGTPFTYSLTCIGGESKKWNILYSCNPENGEYAMWLFYYKRVPLSEVDADTMQKVNETLKRNGLTIKGADAVDNKRCRCK